MGKFLDVSMLNRRAENCPELPELPLTFIIMLSVIFSLYIRYTFMANCMDIRVILLVLNPGPLDCNEKHYQLSFAGP